MSESNEIILEVKHLTQCFGKTAFKAVDDISFQVKKGEVFGIVGESGCGKTTVGRTIMRLYRATSGDVFFKGQRIVAGTNSYKKVIQEARLAAAERIAAYKQRGLTDKVKEEKLLLKKFIEEQNRLIQDAEYDHSNCIRLYRSRREQAIRDEYGEKTKNLPQHSEVYKQLALDRDEALKKVKTENIITQIQMIFQDPMSSLNPRMTVGEIIAEGLRIQGIKEEDIIHEKVFYMLDKVGLLREHAGRYPHEFSGGQRQRIGIARALIMNPELIIADEPVSALDVSVQAQVINLMNDLREELGLTILFIAHDLSVVKYFSDRIAVMYFGKIVELADSDELFRRPVHPYTKSLLSAIPLPDPEYEKGRRRILYTPALEHDYSQEKPELREISKGHWVNCNEKEYKRYISDYNS